MNTKKIRRIRSRLGLKAIYPKPKTSVSRKEHKKYPYLLKTIDIDSPNSAWCADLTYVKIKNRGWIYLMAIIDCHSRYIVAHDISVCQDVDLCTRTVEAALLNSRPNVFNTDQGSQFTSEEFTSLLKSNNITISMDGKGRWADNILIERFFRSIKHESLYLYDFQTINEAKEIIHKYIDFYNNERLHQSLDYSTPAEVYFSKQFNNAA